LLVSEFFYSPLFLLAINAVLAAGIILAVRRLRSLPEQQQAQQLQDPYEHLRSVINSEVRDPATYVIEVGRAVMAELLRIRELGLGRSSTLREAVRAFATYVGSMDGLEDFVAVFERVRYGVEVPSEEDLVKFRAAASSILEALYRRAPRGHA
jgi:hypothetical protein